MLWIGDRLFLADGKPAAIPDLAAVERFDPPIACLSFDFEEEAPWNRYSLAGCYAPVAACPGLLSFLVNTTAGRARIAESDPAGWRFAPLSGPLAGRVSRVPAHALTGGVRSLFDETPAEGWLLRSDHDRIDEDVTCSRDLYLWRTSRCHVLCDIYEESLH